MYVSAFDQVYIIYKHHQLTDMIICHLYQVWYYVLIWWKCVQWGEYMWCSNKFLIIGILFIWWFSQMFSTSDHPGTHPDLWERININWPSLQPNTLNGQKLLLDIFFRSHLISQIWLYLLILLNTKIVKNTDFAD